MSMLAGEDTTKDVAWRTRSGMPVERVYRPQDSGNANYQEQVGEPGEFPYTRGIHTEMYRRKAWTKRYYTGLGTADDTNQRLKYLLERGQTGAILLPDVAAWNGLDADHPRATGHVGLLGYPFTSLRDHERLLDGIPLDKISISLQWGELGAAVAFAAHVATAEKRGVPLHRLRGSILNDSLIFNITGFELATPLEVAPKLSTDIIEFCAANVPEWHPLCSNGYHLGEYGATAAQQVAFTIAELDEFLRMAVDRGVRPEIVSRFVISMGADTDLFEEAAKFRATRRLWARVLKERFPSMDPRNFRATISVKTSGASLTAQQPVNNVVRSTIEALAAVLGGVQSIEPSPYDEPYRTPSAEACTVAINTLHILDHEVRLTNTVDPLGGSYFVEHLTDRIEQDARRILQHIAELGGLLSAIKKGWVQQQLQNRTIKLQQEIEDGHKLIVGMNCYRLPKEEDKLLPITEEKWLRHASDEQALSVTRLKESRDKTRWRVALEELRERARLGERENLILPIKAALESDATIGEILGTIREVYGLSYDPFEVLSSPLGRG